MAGASSLPILRPLSFSIAILSLLYTLAVAATPPSFTPTDSFLVNCGATINTTIYGRTWSPLSQSHLLSLPPNIITASASSSSMPSAKLDVASLLSSACIFPNTSSLMFQVNPARFVVRLYFYPFSSPSYNLNSASFSISAGAFTLVSDLDVASVVDSVASAHQSSRSLYLLKEYSMNVSTSSFTITFQPSIGSSFAFFNALELSTMPNDVIRDLSSPVGVNSPQPLGIPETAVECLYRVNVGGPVISPGNDSGLYRTWQGNESFLFSTAGVVNVSTDPASIVYTGSVPSYFAPRVVYSSALQLQQKELANTFNISWLFPIDPEFLYLVRLHLCEIVLSDSGLRVFDIYVQNQTAFHALDLLANDSPDDTIYRDITVNSSGGIDSLWIQVGPTPGIGLSNNNAILNGIEIWKLNNTAGSLDGAVFLMVPGSQSSKGISVAIIGGLVAGMLVVGIMLACLCFFCGGKTKVYKQSASGWFPIHLQSSSSASMTSKFSSLSRKSGAGSVASSLQSSLGRQFTFLEIQEATHNFDEAQVLGVGGFGKVYRGTIDNGTKIAVKRGNPSSEQGINEFQTEIAMLSKLRHRHLVSLIGYCDENSEMILVYEYMANGSLRNHLYGTDLPPLTWRQRLDICIGAARGLHYLHTGAAQGIIHRDVKTTNILLDENFVAKVSDFGLSKTGPTLDRTHVSTAVKGSFGYLDPEYFRRQQLTEKSDVYSFGVVLMEVLCARPPINPALPREQVNIAEWAMHWQKMGLLEQIVDPHLAGTINNKSLKKFGEMTEKCLAEQGIDRPTMGDVLWSLEYVVQLQEAAATAGELESTNTQRQEVELPVMYNAGWDTSMEMEERSVESGKEEQMQAEDVTPSALFSQLVRPRGR